MDFSIPPDSDDGKPAAYCLYIRTLVHDAVFVGTAPVVTADPNALQQQAEKMMNRAGYDYIRGGTGEGASLDANRRAFRQWQLIPRVLTPTNPRDLSVTLFGEKYDSPILMAPFGIQGVIHQDKEIGVAAACAALRVPFILSTAASTSFEDLVHAVPSSPKWYQLFWPRDDELTVSLLARARACEFKVLVVTLDVWTMTWRPLDLDHANFGRLIANGSRIGLTDPVFLRKFADATGGLTPAELKTEADAYWASEVVPGSSRSWEDLAFLREHWDGPIVLKGIMTTEDALLAAQHGADGIIVSNHGGRQVDGSYGTLDVLPEIVDAVGDRLTVLVDSGFRTGADVIKGLALGAKGVLVGRPVAYGLGIHGRKGAEAVLAGLLADVDTTMGYLGAKSIADLKPSILRMA
ncbi:putative lactate 2-monooxygenase [Escovopsis weberi]|uniref:Putative lactate 2-monooxygenase n=1 Tax=Escovopsis weberi TaxID=150374 RepID=A0A0N0RST4_ESCWE|nr:putative lactate 2-monooxygenase [Escovopsis weberi]